MNGTEFAKHLKFSADMAQDLIAKSPFQMRIDLLIIGEGVRIKVGVAEAADYAPMRVNTERIVPWGEILSFNGNAIYMAMKEAVREVAR